MKFIHLPNHCLPIFLMELKVNCEDWEATELSPPIKVDQMWHLHILDIREYIRDCALLWGGNCIGHNPDGAMDPEARKGRIEKTMLTLKARFGRNYDSEIWTFDGVQGAAVVPAAGRPRVSSSSDGDTSNNNAAVIKFAVRDQAGNELFYRVKKSATMGRLFRAHAKRYYTQPSSLRFSFGREIIKEEDTAEALGLEEGSKIGFQVPSAVAGTVTVIVKMMTGKQDIFKIKTTNTLRVFFESYSQRMGPPVSEVRFIFKGRQLEENDTAGYLGIENGDIIHSILRLTGC